MRAVLTGVSISLFLSVQAQTLVLQEDFTTYAGTSATTPAGWYMSYHGNYTSAAYSGGSGPNAYKFGATNATLVCPLFANADSMTFWLRGASTDTASALMIWETADSANWTLRATLKPLPLTGTYYSYSISTGTIHIKLVFNKSAGNLAFDDFRIWKNGTIPVSPSSGKIKVYFNNPVDTMMAAGVPAVHLNRSIDDTLIAYINRAKYSIDAAIYNFIQDTSVSDIAGALNNAYARDVRIRWISDGSTSNTALALLDTGIHRLSSPTTSAYTIMHNKFFIIDAASPDPNDALVWTGSTNITPQQMNRDVNHVVIIQDVLLSAAYTAEFNEMWGDTGMVPNLINSRFGSYKTNNTPHLFQIGGRLVECYFSPSDQVNSRILKAISSADTDLYFGIFTFTLSSNADSIKSRILNHNVYSGGILDQNSQPHPPYDTLSALMGAQLKLYTNGALVYHNKILIVDPCDPLSDPLVVTGSHNWTASADTKNDENTLIIHDDTLANIFYQSFYQNFSDLGGVLAPCLVSSLTEASSSEITIYPNPFSVQAALKIRDPERIIEITILDMTGRSYRPDVDVQSGEYIIRHPNLSAGIYILTIRSERQVRNVKVVIR